jgi:hypothetical protein
MVTSEEHIEIDTSTAAYRRATMSGWKLGPASLIRIDGDITKAKCIFTCVCGRQEVLLRNMMMFPPVPDGWKWDVAQDLERNGNFSAEHLRQDGYSDTEIQSIRYLYDMEDKLKFLSTFMKHAIARHNDLQFLCDEISHRLELEREYHER